LGLGSSLGLCLCLCLDLALFVCLHLGLYPGLVLDLSLSLCLYLGLSLRGRSENSEVRCEKWEVRSQALVNNWITVAVS
jgi:hypothetical protein